jgi:hypothetical protein
MIQWLIDLFTGRDRHAERMFLVKLEIELAAMKAENDAWIEHQIRMMRAVQGMFMEHIQRRKV